ncbi:hypothetical protein P7C70_g5546, partial [Phenoliferia sp. Uapishka_3]
MWKSPHAQTILPFAKRYPSLASALLRTWDDLSLAQDWKNLEVVDLPECGCAVIKGVPKNKKEMALVLPMNMALPVTMAQLSQLFSALGSEFGVDGPHTVYLGIVEKDSSVVYYVLREGIVSPLEVPE